MGRIRPLVMRFLRSSAGISLLLVAAVCAAYAGLPANEFVDYDDQHYITDNPLVRHGLNWAGIRNAFRFLPHASGNWHPVTWLSHMADWQLFGNRPGWHHAENLAWHAANVVLVFLLLRRTTERIWPSAMVAAVFALHPLNVESVAWAAERKNVLSTFFWLASTWAYVGYTRDQSPWKYLVSLGLFALGLMTKPMLVTLPCTLLLWDYWPLERGSLVVWSVRRLPLPDQLERWWQLLGEKLPYFALAVASSVITVMYQTEAIATLDVFSVGQRAATVLTGYVTYLARMVWPTGLAVLYPVDPALLAWGPSLAAALVLVAITLAVFWPLRHRPYFAIGWLWFLGTLFPVAGVLQAGVHATADRYIYVPMLGLLMMSAFGFDSWSTGWRHRTQILAAVSATVLIGCGVLTFRQVGFWRTRLALFEHALAVGAPSSVAHYNVAVDRYLLLQKRRRAGATIPSKEYEEIIGHLREALRLDPTEMEPRLALARLLAKRGELKPAIVEFDYVLSIDRRSTDAMFGRGIARYNLGKLVEAMRDFEHTLEIDPKHGEARYNLAKTLFALRRVEEGVRHLRLAVKANPRDLLTRRELASIAMLRGRPAEAVALLREVVQIDPTLPDTHIELGLQLEANGQTKEAAAEYQEALRLNPQSAESANNLAWLRATAADPTLRDPTDAVRLAEQACTVTKYQSAGHLDTLAAAYAAAGRFDQAIEFAEKSVQIAEAANQIDRARRMQQRLNQYRRSQPFVQGQSG